MVMNTSLKVVKRDLTSDISETQKFNIFFNQKLGSPPDFDVKP